MTLNHDRLEMIGRIETIRRQLGLVTAMILNGASNEGVQTALGQPTGDLAESRNALKDMEDFNVA